MTEFTVESTPWAVEGGTVVKRCSYEGLKDDGQSYELEITIPSSRSHYTGLLEPRFEIRLRPDPLQEAYLPEAVSGKLIVPGSPFDQPEQPIDIAHSDHSVLTLATTSVRDAETFVELISAGQDMRFVLLARGEPVLELPIPNDPGVITVLRNALDA